MQVNSKLTVRPRKYIEQTWSDQPSIAQRRRKKMFIFLTKTDGQGITLNKNAILMMEETAQGTKITTSILDGNKNLVIEVRDKFTSLCFMGS